MEGSEKPVLCAGETCVHNHYTVKKCWQHDAVPCIRQTAVQDIKL
jgi:hypothetical protein